MVDTYLSLQLSRFSGIFYRIRNLILFQVTKMFYYCFMYLRIQYDMVIWGNISKIYLKDLSVRLNNIIRKTTFSKKYSHVTNLYKNLNLLKLNDIYKLELAKCMYQLHHGTLPKLFYDRFIKLSAIHNYSTRQKQNLEYFKPQINKVIGREMLTHRSCSHLWKEIKPSIKNLGWFFLKHNTKNFLLKITIPL